MSNSPRYIAKLIEMYRKEGLLHTFIACEYKPNRMLNYMFGKHPPHYPVPAIPYRAELAGYRACIYVDTLQYGENDPHMVCVWDFYVTPAYSMVGCERGKYFRIPD